MLRPRGARAAGPRHAGLHQKRLRQPRPRARGPDRPRGDARVGLRLLARRGPVVPRAITRVGVRRHLGCFSSLSPLPRRWGGLIFSPVYILSLQDLVQASRQRAVCVPCVHASAAFLCAKASALSYIAACASARPAHSDSPRAHCIAAPRRACILHTAYCIVAPRLAPPRLRSPRQRKKAAARRLRSGERQCYSCGYSTASPKVNTARHL